MSQAGSIASGVQGDGSLVLLNKQTASGSANIAFTSLISASYSSYVVRITNVLPSTNNVSLLMTWSTNNGGSYIASGYGWTQAFQTTFGFDNNDNNGDTSLTIYENAPNNAGQGSNGIINLYSMNDAVNFPNYSTLISGYINGGPACNAIYGSGAIYSANQINALNFAMSLGNIASGSFTLYGLMEA